MQNPKWGINIIAWVYEYLSVSKSPWATGLILIQFSESNHIFFY